MVPLEVMFWKQFSMYMYCLAQLYSHQRNGWPHIYREKVVLTSVLYHLLYNVHGQKP